jgi:hypothetical protein
MAALMDKTRCRAMVPRFGGLSDQCKRNAVHGGLCLKHLDAAGRREEYLRLEVYLGEAGLWYVTSPDIKGLLVAEKTRDEAIRKVPDGLGDLARAEHVAPATL